MHGKERYHCPRRGKIMVASHFNGWIGNSRFNFCVPLVTTHLLAEEGGGDFVLGFEGAVEDDGAAEAAGGGYLADTHVGTPGKQLASILEAELTGKGG